MSKPTLKESMSQCLVSVRWNHALREAAVLMEKMRIRHLPVIGEDGSLAGILSDRDAKRAMDVVTASYTLHTKVGDFMSWPVITRPESAPLTEVVELMIQKKISAVVVTRQEAMCGIVTSEDLLLVLRDLLGKERERASLTLADITTSPLFFEAAREASAAGL